MLEKLLKFANFSVFYSHNSLVVNTGIFEKSL